MCRPIPLLSRICGYTVNYANLCLTELDQRLHQR